MTEATLSPTNPMRRALAARDFNLLWIGQLASLLGDQFYIVAATWLVLKLTKDPLALGTVLALGTLPRAAMVLVGGAITDRFSPRLIMLTSDILRLLLTAVMAILVLDGSMQIWMVYAFSLVYGVISGFFSPASNAIVPYLLPEQDLQAGNAIFQGGSQLVSFIGPALAGVVIGLVAGMNGIGLALIIDALSFVVSVITLWLMQNSSVGAVILSAETVLGSIRTGIRYAFSDPFLRLIFILLGFANLLFAGPIVVGIPVLADQRLPGGPTAYGLILSAYGGGNLLGIILCGALPRPPAKIMKHFLVGLLVLFGAAVIYLGWLTNTWIGILLMLFVGTGNGYLGIMLFTTLQQRTPKEMMGRLMSLVLLANIGLMPISQALAGVVSRWNLTVLFVFAGAGILLLCLWLVLQPTLDLISNFMGQPAKPEEGS